MTYVTGIAGNVAERLLTGNKAEMYFIHHCEQLVKVPQRDLLDLRQNACGYDFGVKKQTSLAFEVKDLKNQSGSILFTDREWIEANQRRSDYLVVIVGDLDATPTVSIIVDPVANLDIRGSYRTTVVREWSARVSV